MCPTRVWTGACAVLCGCAVLLVCGVLGGGAFASEPGTASDSPPAEFSLALRHRVPVAAGSGQYHTLTEPACWPAAQTAVIVCDMWDSHHCLNAVAEPAVQVQAVPTRDIWRRTHERRTSLFAKAFSRRRGHGRGVG